MKITLEDGYEIEVNDEGLDDWNVLEGIHEMEKGNAGYIVDVANAMLTEASMYDLKNHLRNENGRVKASDMSAAIIDIIQKLKDGKK